MTEDEAKKICDRVLDRIEEVIRKEVDAAGAEGVEFLYLFNFCINHTRISGQMSNIADHEQLRFLRDASDKVAMQLADEAGRN